MDKILLFFSPFWETDADSHQLREKVCVCVLYFRCVCIVFFFLLVCLRVCLQLRNGINVSIAKMTEYNPDPPEKKLAASWLPGLSSCMVETYIAWLAGLVRLPTVSIHRTCVCDVCIFFVLKTA